MLWLGLDDFNELGLLGLGTGACVELSADGCGVLLVQQELNDGWNFRVDEVLAFRRIRSEQVANLAQDLFNLGLSGVVLEVLLDNVSDELANRAEDTVLGGVSAVFELRAGSYAGNQ